MVLERFGGRRFDLALLSQVSAKVLVWAEKIDGVAYGLVITATVAAYITGNVVQKRNEGREATAVETQ